MLSTETRSPPPPLTAVHTHKRTRARAGRREEEGGGVAQRRDGRTGRGRDGGGRTNDLARQGEGGGALVFSCVVSFRPGECRPVSNGWGGWVVVVGGAKKTRRGRALSGGEREWGEWGGFERGAAGAPVFFFSRKRREAAQQKKKGAARAPLCLPGAHPPHPSLLDRTRKKEKGRTPHGPGSSKGIRGIVFFRGGGGGGGGGGALNGTEMGGRKKKEDV